MFGLLNSEGVRVVAASDLAVSDLAVSDLAVSDLAVSDLAVSEQVMSEAARAAGGLPGAGSLGFVGGVDPAVLSAADLVDAVLVTERLLAHVHGLQAGLLAELGLPNRCADVSTLVDAVASHRLGRGLAGDPAAAGASKSAGSAGPAGVDGVDESVSVDGSAGVGGSAGCAGSGSFAGAGESADVAEEVRDRSIAVAATELAAVLNWSPITARIRIEQSARLSQSLPATLTALRTGNIDINRARMIVDRTMVLDPSLCAGVEKKILPLATGRSRAALEQLVDRAVIIADPIAAERRRTLARHGRTVTHYPDKDGTGIINALLPAEAAVTVFTIIDLIAQANKGIDHRSISQLRADALTDIADQLLTHGYVDLDGLTTTLSPPPANRPAVPPSPTVTPTWAAPAATPNPAATPTPLPTRAANSAPRQAPETTGPTTTPPASSSPTPTEPATPPATTPTGPVLAAVAANSPSRNLRHTPSLPGRRRPSQQ